MSSGFTLFIPAYGLPDGSIAEPNHMHIFYPFGNAKVPELIYERVERLYCDNYLAIGNVVRAYLDCIKRSHARDGGDVSLGPTIDLINLVGHFDHHMHSETPCTEREYLTHIAMLHDLIGDHPGIITAPIHDQFYARLYQLLMHEEHIPRETYNNYRGFVIDITPH